MHHHQHSWASLLAPAGPSAAAGGPAGAQLATQQQSQTPHSGQQQQPLLRHHSSLLHRVGAFIDQSTADVALDFPTSGWGPLGGSLLRPSDAADGGHAVCWGGGRGGSSGSSGGGGGGGYSLLCHSQVLSTWSPVLADVLSAAAASAAGGAAAPAATSANAANADGSSSDSAAASAAAIAAATAEVAGPLLRIPLPSSSVDTPEAWAQALELMYPPARLPRPSLTWHNLDPVLSLADKYGMTGLLLLCEEFLLGGPAAVAAVAAAEAQAAVAAVSAPQGGADGSSSESQQRRGQQLQVVAGAAGAAACCRYCGGSGCAPGAAGNDFGSSSGAGGAGGPAGLGGGWTSHPAVATATRGFPGTGIGPATAAYSCSSSSAGALLSGHQHFSSDPTDPAYVWRWLLRADQLRMERVVALCCDFVCHAEPPPPPSASAAYPAGAATAAAAASPSYYPQSPAEAAGTGAATSAAPPAAAAGGGCWPRPELLAALRPETLCRLVGRLVDEAGVMRAALRNEGFRLHSAVTWSLAPPSQAPAAAAAAAAAGAGGGAAAAAGPGAAAAGSGGSGGGGSTLMESRRWQLAVADPQHCRWRLKGTPGVLG
ncbi:hypothetical protein HXX76_012966 [Chlamydomonas incerta]|uniref:BTB domain-containing protein n=1 Tax=Chlamydomonas incerta TaxID=51695 RepID=A0A835SGP3_CHLIN|nr:hypothetical protein HXX76_012966 [Chlamydomonas incerta]|eukprot:KAG2426654.1 hypothetical protein HXX76_012966 [Chlamydomonas incerta]